ncbi:MAG: T9SS type A sorting domain-containing protein [Flavobacteriales bacterium]|nr:T9SS type A sorting domain-containing protein [Flavobacteriales bacterium]
MLTNSNYKLMISKINSLNSENACITSNDIATSSDVTLSSVNYQILEVTNSEYSNTSIQAIDASITVTNGCEILSVPQKSITTFSLHPNPANDFLQLTTENPTGEYQLLDAQGRLILKEKIISSTQQIDLKGIQSGIYFVEIDGNVKRFIKE